jgi:hypothetical protein
VVERQERDIHVERIKLQGAPFGGVFRKVTREFVDCPKGGNSLKLTQVGIVNVEDRLRRPATRRDLFITAIIRVQQEITAASRTNT